MSLIDATYFSTPDCNLPQGTYETISEHVTRYERDILIQLLGYDLAKLVLAYNSSTSPQRIKDIVEGKEYTLGTYTVKWNGLKNDQKISILSYYVFIEYIKNYSESFQNIGAVTAPGTKSPAGLLQRAGVRLRELAGYSGQDAYAPSLYNFMTNSIATYPEWIFNEFHSINQFDI